jgi:NhaP-type Na+/H+ or K+/H+ antiporter
MIAVLAFAITLLVAVLLSGLARRSVLSTVILFLIAGFIVGPGMLDALHVRPESEIVVTFIELVLFGVLFTDAMHIGVKDLISAWHLPGRALLFGMPLTLIGIALLAHWLAGLSWVEAFLIGAVLSPTDPVFATAIVGREEILYRLRHLLNVESGLNDGLALPIVLSILAISRGTDFHPLTWLGELGLGVGLGVVIPWTVLRLEQSRFFWTARVYEPLLAFAIGLLVYALASLIEANLFLAAYLAGIIIATVDVEVRNAFYQFGEPVIEVLKLAAVLIFGALLSPSVLRAIPASTYLFALLVMVLARPLALYGSLVGSNLNWQERAAVAWFGPKGFASVVYGLFVFKSGIPQAKTLFYTIAVVILGSIIAHSSTDVLVARWFKKRESEEAKEQDIPLLSEEEFVDFIEKRQKKGGKP